MVAVPSFCHAQHVLYINHRPAYCRLLTYIRCIMEIFVFLILLVQSSEVAVKRSIEIINRFLLFF